MSSPPVALTIAGSDSGGGAGIQADLKTFSARGVFGCSAITALTAQNTTGVQGIFAVSPEFVQAQIDSVFNDFEVAAVKIGMLGNAEIIAAVAAGLRRHRAVNIVLDPVMVAKGGAPLLRSEAVQALRFELLPLADILTPNLPEAAALLDSDVANVVNDPEHAAAKLHALGPRAVLVKGGHADGAESVDVLFDGTNIRPFAGARIDTKNTHGTGCTLSSAIAAELAKGIPRAAAVQAARAYIQRAIEAGAEWQLGRGHGPVQHFVDWWGSND